MRWWLVSVLVLVAVHAPFLISWMNWMWARDHYQYFPLIMLGSAWLIWQRSETIRWPSSPSLSVRVGIYLLFSAILFLLAVRSNSDLGGLLSFLSLLWTSVWNFGGRTAVSELRGPIGFLALMIPLPLNLDTEVIIDLQKIATSLASGALDLRHLRHTVSGVVIRTPDKAFLVEEACSGIHSLFSAVSAMTFLGVYCRYGLVRIVVTVIQTTFWVVAANSFRVFLLVFAESRWQMPLDTGWRHETLGFATYTLVLLFALSTDQLVRFAFPLAEGSIKILQAEFDEKFGKHWKKFVSGLLDEPRLRGRVAVLVPALLMGLVYLPLGTLSAAQKMKGTDGALTAAASVGALPEIAEEILPQEIEGWTRDDFQKVTRDPDDPFGMTSFVWTYAGHGMQASISLDGMYSEWHDLTYCYKAIGWSLHTVSNGVIPVAGHSWPHTELQLYRNAGDHAAVYFSCFDSQNVPVAPPEATGSFLRTLKNRLVAGGMMQNTTAYVPPVFQVQLMLVSPQEMLPHERESLERLFGQVRAEILRQFTASR